MPFELDQSDLPPLSRSSSTYSDDYITTANSNGTLVHHRSHLRPLDGGTPRPYHENRGRVLGPSSSFSIVYGEGVPADRLGIDQSFETIEVAEARRRWSATLARVETPPRFAQSLVDEGTPDHTPEEIGRAPLSNIDINDISPRPPTPPRLRPRIHGLNNRFSISSRLSAADSWVTMSEDQNRMSTDFDRPNAFYHAEDPVTPPLRAVQSAGVLRPQNDASNYMLPPTNLRPARSLRQAPHDFHRSKFGGARSQSIYSRPPPVFSLGRHSLTDSSSSNGDEIVSSREALGPPAHPPQAVQHRVAKVWSGQLVIDTILEAPEEHQQQGVPAQEKNHVKGDMKAGYANEEYVTDLEKMGGKKEKKKGGVFKGILRLAKK